MRNADDGEHIAHIELLHGPLEVIIALLQSSGMGTTKEHRRDLATQAFGLDGSLNLLYFNENRIHVAENCLSNGTRIHHSRLPLKPLDGLLEGRRSSPSTLLNGLQDNQEQSKNTVLKLIALFAVVLQGLEGK